VSAAKQNRELNVANQKRSAYRIAKQLMRESMVVNSEFDAGRTDGCASRPGEALLPNGNLPIAKSLHPVAPSCTQLHQNIFIFGANGRFLARSLACLLLFFSIFALPARAALQFDVFLGYDGVVPNGTWIPVVCEIKNDGPSFNGVVEVDSDAGSSGQKRRMAVELPTGTLKRITIPVISTTRNYQRWDVRLLDERGKVRGEQLSIQVRKEVNAGTPILGALPRTASFTPSLQPIKLPQPGMQPAAARLLPTIFPDNPLVLEGMSALYLNSAKAADLRLREPNQVDALYRWLNAGGHLIVGVEQISDITATPWLEQLFPVELKEIKTVRRHPELQEWLRTGAWTTNATRSQRFPQMNFPGQRRKNPQFPQTSQPQVISGGNPFGNLDSDSNFELAEIQVAAGTLRDGQVIQDSEDTPLMISANRGRGRITVLMFSPEREPFRSWKNLPTFWAKLADVPADLYLTTDYGYRGEVGSDGVFGAMIDTRQVHKLPVEWLLLLLIVYLVVIGPLDQFWLKKIGKPMLTWITFPCYVVMFSLLIYFIGYKLRAGESEWNEFHLVDVFVSGDNAQLRGRTYASIYAPSNQRYEVEGDEKYATLRGEYVPTYGANQSTEKANVMQYGDTFKAEIFVPVWTSQLFISDWWQPAAVPLAVTVTPQGEGGWQVKAENRTDNKLTNAKIAIEGYVMELGEIPAKQTKFFKVARGQGMTLRDFVATHGQNFSAAAHSRQRSFGGSESGQIGDMPNSTVAASFLSQLDTPETFIAPPGLDMSSAVAHGNAVLFAWAADYTPVKPLYHITPKRAHQNTMWRVTVPVGL
jgi:hypothetical protein